jgi:hypothetical protein
MPLCWEPPCEWRALAHKHPSASFCSYHTCLHCPAWVLCFQINHISTGQAHSYMLPVVRGPYFKGCDGGDQHLEAATCVCKVIQAVRSVTEPVVCIGLASCRGCVQLGVHQDLYRGGSGGSSSGARGGAQEAHTAATAALAPRYACVGCTSRPARLRLASPRASTGLILRLRYMLDMDCGPRASLQHLVF